MEPQEIEQAMRGRPHTSTKAGPVWDDARARLAELGMSDEEFRDLVDPLYWS
ncbi:hypothetical protein [Acrocarpospora sp. B8E8]|uniref:hypothetical protein n=1 Tax=Acrocarpospora sp. B8E8 TaxID=3153572 RepID=UPI00325E7AF1